MKTKNVFLTLYALITLGLIAPVTLQRQHYRPLPKCDWTGRCIPNGDYMGDYMSEKERHPMLTRDDYRVRPLDDKDLSADIDKTRGERSGGFGGGYNPNPTVNRYDDIKPSGGGRPAAGGDYGGGYKPKLPADSDEDTKTSGGGRPSSGYNPKPPGDRDDYVKPPRGRRSDGDYSWVYKPLAESEEDVKLFGGGRSNSGYNPKPLVDRDDDLKRPRERPSGGGVYGWGYKPFADSEEDVKPLGGGRPVGYDPKPTADRDDDIKSSGGRPDESGGYGGGYKLKPPVDRDDDLKPPRGERPSSGGGGMYLPKPSGERYGVAMIGRPNECDRGYDHKPPYNRDYDIKPTVQPSYGGFYRGAATRSLSWINKTIESRRPQAGLASEGPTTRSRV